MDAGKTGAADKSTLLIYVIACNICDSMLLLLNQKTPQKLSIKKPCLQTGLHFRLIT
jgi:arginine exporter protein ArgO